MYIIADRMTANGLMLGGTQGLTIADESDIAQKLSDIPQDEKTILVTSTLAEVAETEIERLKKRGIICIIIPDMVSGHEDTTKKLIKEAVGFELG